MGWGMVAFGGLLTLRHRLRLRSFLKRQARLRRRYAICSEEPILPYGARMEKSIRQAASRIPAPHYYAVTSGSTAEPKRILYNRARLRSVKWTFSEVFLRMVHRSPIRRKSLYVFSSLQQEGESLTGLMLRERGDVSFFSTLQAPYRIHRHPDLQQLTELYGDAALRLWVLALANPGLLYSTNPSTIAYFLDRLAHDWTASSSLVRDFHDRPADFAPRVLKLARRLESRGARARLQAIACASRPMSFSECAPGVEAYICWTGGYVKPFLERIETDLPRARYLRVPMYSMSTETIETVSSFEDGEARFVPMAPGVLYEFLEEGTPDEVENLRCPWELEVGKSYSMVVTDGFGLRRYQTDDVFLCRGKTGGLPDLRFLRCRSLSYSFTGEKLTGEQLLQVFISLREELGELLSGFHLTLVPSKADNEPVPHYKLLLVDYQTRDTELAEKHNSRSFDESLAMRCEALLEKANPEYRSKVASGRLGKLRLRRLPLETFVAMVGGERQLRSWEGQFKFLPLYRGTWESLSEPEGRSEESPVFEAAR